MKKLAIIATHPIQYQAPWFAYMQTLGAFELKVFYLWNAGSTQQYDVKFDRTIKWDIPILQGYDFDFVPNTSSQPGTHSFWGLKNPDLAHQIQSYKPSAILCLGYAYWSFLSLLTNPLIRHFPIIFRGDSHCRSSSPPFKRIIKNIVLPRLFKRYQACLYVGAASREYFKLYGVPDQKLYFCPHAVPDYSNLFSSDELQQKIATLKEDCSIGPSDFVFSFIGKFEKKKRPDLLLRSFLKANIPKSHLLLVGSGQLEAVMRAEACGASHVHFLGFRNQSELPPIYASTHTLVLPSVGPYETWGLVVNEAAHYAVPALISSDVGCADDLVLHNSTGLVFPASHPESLISHLQLAHQQRDEMLKMGRAAQERLPIFSYETATDGLLQALDQC